MKLLNLTLLSLLLLPPFLAAQEEVIEPSGISIHLQQLLEVRKTLAWQLQQDDIRALGISIADADRRYQRTIWLSRKERFLLSLAQRDVSFLRHLPKFSDEYLTMEVPLGYEYIESRDYLPERIEEYLSTFRNRILEDLAAQGADSEELDFARLIILRYAEHASKQEVNEMVDRFVEQYPFARHTSFVDEKVRISNPPRAWQYVLSFYTGTNSFNNNLETVFPAQWAYGLSLEIIYGSYVMMFDNQFTKPVNAKREVQTSNSLWLPAARYQVYVGSFNLGYRFTRGPVYFTPFAGLSLQHIYTAEDDISVSRSNEVTKTPLAGAVTYGMQVDFRLSDSENRLAVRLRMGRSDANFESRYDQQFSGAVRFLHVGLCIL